VVDDLALFRVECGAGVPSCLFGAVVAALGDLRALSRGWFSNMMGVQLQRRGLRSATLGSLYNARGSLNLYIQIESPGPDKESNCLPASKRGELGLTLRLYASKPQVVDGRWNPPPITRFTVAVQLVDAGVHH
jgi:Protein of unknown function (DUF1214)